MNSSHYNYYKYCMVPQCKSTSIKTPNKTFIYIPQGQIRKKWLTLARRDDAHCLSTNTKMYFCEDHFDLENDMANYMQYKIMGSVGRIQMKPDCMPSRFDCQTDGKRKTTPTPDELQYDHDTKKSKRKKKAVTPISEGSEPDPGDEAEIEEEVPKVCRTCLASGVRMFDVAAVGLQDTFEHVTGTELENDMANYMQYKIMGSVGRIQMKPDCMPSRFDCQTDGKRKTTPTPDELQYDHDTKKSKRKKKAVTPISEGSEPDPGDEAEIEEEVPKVCRTCLASGVRMFDVAAVGLQDTFEHVTGTELNTSDERPTQVCFVCCSQLQRFRAFCQMFRKAETYMTKLVKKGLQITEQAVSKRHRLIKPKLDVTENPLITIHTLEDSNECAFVEVKVEVVNEEQDNNVSDSETESENEIGSEVKTGTHNRERENETEERLSEYEIEREIKIEIDEANIEELDPFEAVEHTTVKDEACYCLQCTEAFPSQSELLKHVQNHTHKKLKQVNSTNSRTKPNVKAKITKRNVKTKLEAQCKFCNMTFAIKTQLVTHVATEHGIGDSSQAQKPKRRKPNIPKKRSKQ